MTRSGRIILLQNEEIWSLSIGKEYLSDDETERTEYVPELQQTNIVPKDEVEDHWYLGGNVSQDFHNGFKIFLIWLVLYNYIIPISMFVTLEIQKFLSSMLFGWDIGKVPIGQLQNSSN